MSKIICDVCGTQYPESAEQCPICGRVRAAGVNPAADNVVMDSTEEELRPRVKGGRFSKSNVRKRNRNTPRYEMQEAKGRTKARDTFEDEYDETPRRDRSNTVINILLVVVILALLAVSAYIFVQYFLPNVIGAEETVATTEAVPETTVPVTEELTIPTVPCTSLDLADTEILLEEEGQMYLLNVAVAPEDTTDVLTFVSSDESVVTVNDEGRITAVGDGDAVITITCGSQMVECNVVCFFVAETTEPPTEAPTEAPTEPLKDVELGVTKTDITFKVKGQQYQFKLTCDLDNKEVTWTSENENIVTVDETGMATCTGKGTTNIIAKYGDQEVTIIVRCSLG